MQRIHDRHRAFVLTRGVARVLLRGTKERAWEKEVPQRSKDAKLRLFPWGHRSPHPNDISIGTAVFAQLTTDGPYRVQWAALSPSKLPLHIGDLDHPSNTWFPGTTQAHIPNDISIGSATLAGLTILSDGPTDRPRYAVRNNTPNLCGTEMRPNKNRHWKWHFIFIWLN